jgi:transmembrane sensor
MIMKDSEKFTRFLQAHMAGKATAEEYRGLMQMIKSGQYDDLLKQHIDESLRYDQPTADLDVNRAQDVLYHILNSERQTAKLIPASKSWRRHYWYAAAAAALLIITLTIWGLAVKTNDKTLRVAATEKKILEPAPETNGKRYIRLQDGSTVLLNEGSQLDYPAGFANDKREVTLIGEAYFDIKSDPQRPFIVHTGNVKTTVLGTAFNIKAYPEQKQITVTVTRGKVKVGDNKKTFGIIVPNESIAVNTEINTYKLERVNAEDVVEWKKQYLVLDDISLEEAAVLIGNKYHVNISFAKEELKNCRIKATFLNNENMEQVLTVVTGVINADYSLQPNDQVIFSGEGCK